MSGMDLPHAIMITIPEPWENNKVISQEKRDFYQLLCNDDGTMGWDQHLSFSQMVIR